MPEKEKRSRLDKNPDAQFPPLEWGWHIVGYLFEVGPALSNGMGLSPLCDRDLLAWQENQGFVLSPWECRTIIRLSRIYTSGISLYADPKSLPPWSPEVSNQSLESATNAWQDWAKKAAAKNDPNK